MCKEMDRATVTEKHMERKEDKAICRKIERIPTNTKTASGDV